MQDMDTATPAAAVDRRSHPRPDGHDARSRRRSSKRRRGTRRAPPRGCARHPSRRDRNSRIRRRIGCGGRGAPIGSRRAICGSCSRARACRSTEYVLDQRLALAHRLLSDPRRASEKIHRSRSPAGFSNLSYFYRAFRRRYDLLPSDVRAQARDCADVSPRLTRRASALPRSGMPARATKQRATPTIQSAAAARDCLDTGGQRRRK